MINDFEFVLLLVCNVSTRIESDDDGFALLALSSTDRFPTMVFGLGFLARKSNGFA
jgi:hypothetical protein